MTQLSKMYPRFREYITSLKKVSKPRQCPYCKKYFNRIPSSKQVCCSRKCRAELMKLINKSNYKLRKCPICHDEFEVNPRSKRKQCSRKCYLLYVKTLRVPQQRNCSECNKVYNFGRIEGVVNWRSIFCSKKCSKIANQKRHPKKILVCKWCAKKWLDKAGTRHKFCSVRCRKAFGRNVTIIPLLKAQKFWKHLKPNKAEQLLIPILKPFGFEYVGDWSVNIGRFNPDFIHKKLPLIIEFFGDYWHSKEDISRKRYHFGTYGYRCLIIWEHQLQKSPKRIVDRVKAFVAKAA